MRFAIGSLVAFVALCTGITAFDAQQAQTIKDELKKARIIPDVMDEFEPLTQMKITFHDDLLLDIGQEVTPEDLEEVPHIWFKPPSDEAHYTLIMADSDSEERLVRHWVAININGTKPGASFRDPSREHQYTSYGAPMPAKDTGKHRFVFALFEQQEKTQTMLPAIEKPEEHRGKFDMNQFARDNHLKPVAATYIVAEYHAPEEGVHLDASEEPSASAAAVSSASAAASVASSISEPAVSSF